MKSTPIWIIILSISLFTYCTEHKKPEDSGPRRIEMLFLGHDSDHHPSAELMPILAAALAKDGINLTYTDKVEDLNHQELERYDGLIIYANHEYISPTQEQALLDFVESGKGFVPIHCASYCFHNSDKYIDLVGAQFLKHKTDSFKADIIKKDHPAVSNVSEFSTWDETYIHHKHADDRTVLMERIEGDHREPWTWVKEYGDGRVFYTAYGHDERTWNNPGFQQLVKQGILWSVGPSVYEKWDEFSRGLPQLVYKPMDNIPNYEKRDPKPQYVEPLSPEESKKLIQVPQGFELSLFASEPDIINPIAMDWDEKGRLWVIETVDYPNTVRNEDGVGDDRIKICEDTDGDGKADKFTVFADDLNIPTSLVFANGGVIVSQAPHFLFLKDTNGDDKADVRETIITGWGTFDTHAGPSNLKYGIDNNIWGVVGYSSFEGVIANEPRKFRQGIYRFAPDVSSFEYLTRTSNNTWGLGFTEDNEVFASTANNTHSVYLGIPDRYYQGVEGIKPVSSEKIDGHYAMHPITDKVRQVDVWGGFTAASGHNFYTAREYPASYWNKTALVCEPTGHLVHIAKIEKSGAGYKEKDGWNLFASADEWVAPVEAKVGPDGQVWVADWYNFIVQHNPTPSPDRGGYQAENGEGNAYENPLRDKQHGRIWRVVYKGSDPEKKQITSLSKDDPEGLINALKSDNMFWRFTAQRLLVERQDEEVLPSLYKLVRSNSLDEIGVNPAGMHALWIMGALGALDGSNQEAYEVVVKALGHNSAAVRKAAVELLPVSLWSKEELMASKVLADEDPQVRLAAILKLAEMPSSVNTGKLLYRLSMDSEYGSDPWLSRAIYTSAVRNRQGFMDSYLASNPNFSLPLDSSAYETLTDREAFMVNYYSAPSTDQAVLAESSGDAKQINISVIKNQMKYDIKDFTVKAGETVEIVFTNPDFMQHNLLIIQPGQLEVVGAAADELARSPDGAEKNYVPQIPQVLYSTPLVDPNNTVRLTFKAPSQPGDYPFVCTFPGHWRLMNGIMRVTGSEVN